LLHHDDYRVRRETLNALTVAGSEEAQGLVAEFLDDPDERLRMRAMQSLGSWEAWKAMPKLLAILDRRDPWNRTFELKRTALETLARLSARQSLPIIKRLARVRLIFGRRGRELRRLAGVTAAIIEGTMPPEAQVLLASDHRTGSRP
jgi:HEAT repeat protein